MTREHDIEELAVYIRQGLVNLKNHRPEFCDFAWANRDAMIRALSSLAAENGRMAAVVKAATMLHHSGYDSRTMLFAMMCDAVDKYAALSSPAPEGMAGGDEVVP